MEDQKEERKGMGDVWWEGEEEVLGVWECFFGWDEKKWPSGLALAKLFALPIHILITTKICFHF